MKIYGLLIWVREVVMSGFLDQRTASTPILDTTFEAHYSVGELARQWKLGRETVRLLVKDELGVVKIRMGRRKALTRYSVPESVARRVHTKLVHPVARASTA
jgi:hypothetical protein